MAIVAPSKCIFSTGYQRWVVAFAGFHVENERKGWQTRRRMGGVIMSCFIGIWRLWESASTVVLVNNGVVVFATILGGVILFREAGFLLLEIFEDCPVSMDFNDFRKLNEYRNVQTTSALILHCPKPFFQVSRVGCWNWVHFQRYARASGRRRRHDLIAFALLVMPPQLIAL